MKLPKYILPASIIGSAIGGIVLFKDYIGGDKYKDEVRIPGKTVIITGANSGIGFETAKSLSKRGGRVIMACRDMEACEDARNKIMKETINRNVHCRKLDLASLKSVREFADDINQNESRLDVLINNAGVMNCPQSLTEDGFEMHLGVNHLGHFLLTNLLLDKLKACAPSRVVTVTSIAHTKGRINFHDLNSSENYRSEHAYFQSKLANILFSEELAKRLEGTKVTSSAVYPGLSKTNLGRHMGMNKSYISSTLLSPVFWVFFRTPEQGARTVTYTAIEPSISDETGKYYFNQMVVEPEPTSRREEISKRLWDISENWTRLKE